MSINMHGLYLGTLHLAIFFFFNDTATTEIYTLSLHDALPICGPHPGHHAVHAARPAVVASAPPARRDRKSTRLNSSHLVISYAVFCLTKTQNSGTCDAIYTAKATRHHPQTAC